jgi:hypothetical protein
MIDCGNDCPICFLEEIIDAKEARIKELEDGSCRFNCRKVGKLHKIIDRIEKHSEKTVHAPKHRLVLYSDLQDLIRERKGEKDKR